jgi:alpha-ribazole phosphatase
VLAGLGSFVPEIVWSSPALRCHAMAAALQNTSGADLRRDPRLLEMDFGKWEGVPWDTISRADLDRWAADPWDFAAPGGETGRALVARITAFHDDILAEGRDCAVVTHGGPLKVLRALRKGSAIDLMAPSMPIGGWEIL